MTGAQIVIEVLREQGVSDVFGYPGSQVLSIYDELYKAKDKINHILCAHEQGAAHAADGYARASGNVGVVIATSGPGATNLVTGIATAMLDSIPMVAITGNVPTSRIGKDSFQEINITGITMPITKHNYFVQTVSELADTIREAFRIAKSGRPGPVLIDIPKDVQLAECDFVPQSEVSPFGNSIAAEEKINIAAHLINRAKRPYIYIGGGAIYGETPMLVCKLAEKIDAFIGSSLMGLSILPNSYSKYLGMQGMHGRPASNAAWDCADLIIGIGTRFSDRAIGNSSGRKKSAKIIHLDIDQSEICKTINADVGVVGDISDSLARIIEKCEESSHPTWAKEVRSFLNSEKSFDSQSSASKIFSVINRLKSKNSPVATDVGQHQMWAAQHLVFDTPRRFLTSGGLGTMGYGLGAAIGAQIASGQHAILITGDGSFGMNLTELATAVSYRLPIIIVLINNRALGLVRQWQTVFFDARHSCTNLDRKTDFIKVSEGFGANASRVESVDEFEVAFNKALNLAGPSVIEFNIGRDELVLPMVTPGDIIAGK